MRRFFGAVAPLLLIFLAFGLTAEAQMVNGPDRFETREACRTAVLTGRFSYYEPSFQTGHLPLAPGEELRREEEIFCSNMRIVGRFAFVPQPMRTEVVYRDGVPVRRWDCGNEIKEISYVPMIQPLAAPPPVAPQRQTVAPPPDEPANVSQTQVGSTQTTTIDLGDFLDRISHQPEYELPTGPEIDGGSGCGKWCAAGILAAIALGTWGVIEATDDDDGDGDRGGANIDGDIDITINNPPPPPMPASSGTIPSVGANPPVGSTVLPNCTMGTCSGTPVPVAGPPTVTAGGMKAGAGFKLSF